MKKIENEKIDIVILWVDESDKKWLEEKNKYLGIKGDSNINRFRDLGTLKYLFRGIEKNASWINKVFFITYGHLPQWLNIKNKKLVIVKHEDFIPKQYLPTFNSNVIETNLFRIEELSNNFILFNDDVFILRKIKPEDFFKKGLPKDFYIEYNKKNCSKRHSIMRNNYLEIINKYYNKHDFIKKNINKIFSFNYGINNLKTLKMIGKKEFGDFYNRHLTQPILKDTLKEIWKMENQKMNIACSNKFRADSDIGIAICRYWQLLSGTFYPTSKLGEYFEINNKNEKIVKTIKKKKYKIICINDSKIDVNFEKVRKEIGSAFEKIYKEKSSFEI